MHASRETCNKGWPGIARVRKQCTEYKEPSKRYICGNPTADLDHAVRDEPETSEHLIGWGNAGEICGLRTSLTITHLAILPQTDGLRAYDIERFS